MSGDKLNSETGTDAEPATAVKSPADFGEWLEQVRTQTISLNEPPQEQSAGRIGPRARRWGFAMMVAAFAAGGVIAAEIIFHRPTVEVHGQLFDPWQKPLPGARIFLASDPRVATVSDRQGKFRLPGISAGPQSLVVVAEDVGEEYQVAPTSEEEIDLGSLVYHVPPLRVRMQSGNGADWLSKSEASASSSESQTVTTDSLESLE